MKRIVFFHLFNDYSGSPKVLRMVLEGFLKKQYRVDLVSSKGGVLDELLHYDNLQKHSYSYTFSTNPVIALFRYCVIQLYTFIIAFRWLFCKDIVFYVNTLLPVGAAIAGRLMRKRVVYHYHENAFVKGRFYSLLATLMEKLAHQIICVSAYQASFLNRKKNVVVIPNALSKEFVDRLYPDPNAAFERKTVLMLSSLKEYKGTREFIELSQRMPQYHFSLVINETQECICRFLERNGFDLNDGNNLTIFSRQSDVAPFYNKASVVVSLTNPFLFVETFGLTTLEAMTNALPVIVPQEGGIAELVEDGVNGFKINVQQMALIEERINMLLTDKSVYCAMADKALCRAKEYDCEQVNSSIEALLTKE